MKKLLNFIPTLILIPIFVLIGCDEQPITDDTQRQTITITEFKGVNYLYTVKHDDHLFVVVMDGNKASGLMHHPACPVEKENLAAFMKSVRDKPAVATNKE